MKYSFMSFSCPELSLAEMLSLARRLGYDGLEPRLDCQHRHGVELATSAAQRREIRRQVEGSGVALACLATGCSYSDPATWGQQVEETRRCLDLAADVGCARLRVFGGPLPEGVSRAQAIDLVVRGLLAVADQAEAQAVSLCVETHDDWTNPEHLAEVMRRVGRSAAAINWDIMHPVRQSGATMDTVYQTLGPWIRHVHFHDGSNDGQPLVLRPVGQGAIDHRRAVEILQAAGYEGYLSGEWSDWEPYDIHLPRELAAMKRLEGQSR
ncbi:MAG: sugar phosphate isomerase/epimerase family protein [Anaerolineae bacterium]